MEVGGVVQLVLVVNEGLVEINWHSQSVLVHWAMEIDVVAEAHRYDQLY